MSEHDDNPLLIGYGVEQWGPDYPEGLHQYTVVSGAAVQKTIALRKMYESCDSLLISSSRSYRTIVDLLSAGF